MRYSALLFLLVSSVATSGEGRVGRLGIDAAPADTFELHVDSFGLLETSGGSLRQFPGSVLDWVESDGNVIPLDAGIQRTAHPGWDIAFQVGRVQYAAGEGEGPPAGDAHYAVPFALLEKNGSCTHNGVLTWQLSAGQAKNVAYRIASETCAFLKFDMGGRLTARLAWSETANHAVVATRYREHVARRLPLRTFEDLAGDYPGLDIASFGAVGDMPSQDMGVYGFVVDGVHYRSECQTRDGNYPFCDEMLLPSYSTAKSVFAGLALMRLEKTRAGAAGSHIAALVDECAPSDWGSVTIEHALDMATGHYRDATPGRDEALAEHVEFLYAADHAAKIRFACNFFPRRAPPGETFVYHSSDTYLAGVAMRRVLEREPGPGTADPYRQLVAAPLWEPLGLSAAAQQMRRTDDEEAQVTSGWGLSFVSDDVARIARWLQGDEARAALDRGLLDGALQRNADDPGLEAGDATFRYNNGFWAHDIAGYLGCDQALWVPFMSGYGGIAVVLFPNDTVYYYFSDGRIQRWREAAIESNKIRKLCQ